MRTHIVLRLRALASVVTLALAAPLIPAHAQRFTPEPRKAVLAANVQAPASVTLELPPKR